MSRKVYIGWDSREDIAYQVCKHSIKKYGDNIEVKALKLHELKDRGLVTRPDDPKASTEFTFTRFLVPHLNHYTGWAAFVDCDFLFQTDANKLFELADDRYAVMVVKHDYAVHDGSAKMDGKVQTTYPRKNWSSLILFNCAHPQTRRLTPDVANRESGAYLHRFQWLDDAAIGAVPETWNWLEGWSAKPASGAPNVVHYTRGGPWFADWQNVDYGDLWLAEAARLAKPSAAQP